MAHDELDPLIVRVLTAWARHDVAWGLHPQDDQRWMGVFMALSKHGCTWHPDQITNWIEDNYPGVSASRARTLSAYSEMALALHSPGSSESREWVATGERIAQQVIDAGT